MIHNAVLDASDVSHGKRTQGANIAFVGLVVLCTLAIIFAHTLHDVLPCLRRRHPFAFDVRHRAADLIPAYAMHILFAAGRVPGGTAMAGSAAGGKGLVDLFYILGCNPDPLPMQQSSACLPGSSMAVVVLYPLLRLAS
jgi:hypothetical protein